MLTAKFGRSVGNALRGVPSAPRNATEGVPYSYRFCSSNLIRWSCCPPARACAGGLVGTTLSQHIPQKSQDPVDGPAPVGHDGRLSQVSPRRGPGQEDTHKKEMIFLEAGIQRS